MSESSSSLTSEARAQLLKKHLMPGDLLTHTRCMGCLEEHVFTGYSGDWLCGSPTRDSVKLGASTFPVNDIALKNVTHVNRVPVEVLDFVVAGPRYKLKA